MARRNILILPVLGLMAGTLALFQLADRPDAAPAEESGTEMAVQVTVETIRPEPIMLATEYSGRVSAARRR
ncbi:hypothetical protein JMM63_21220, partial [Rhodovulum sulfidophilum]|uniref:hypothetical protein n=1 Tax=Rhodovulum sulfidophilum TaxID=35806 RepID=UPI0019246D20